MQCEIEKLMIDDRNSKSYINLVSLCDVTEQNHSSKMYCSFFVPKKNVWKSRQDITFMTANF